MKPNYHDALAYLGLGGAHPGSLALTKKMVAREKINSNTKILDAGCGTGQTAAYLAKVYTANVTALDLHPIMLEKAKRRFIKESVKVHTALGNVEQLPFKEKTFDMVLSESVTAFTNPQKTFGEFSRVLKPNGILLGIEMTAQSPLSEEELANIQNVYGISKVLSKQDWKHELQRARFRHCSILSTESVANFLQKGAYQDSINDAQPSPFISPKLHHILEEHQQLTLSYAEKLGYSIFRAVK